jgi:UDP-2-acetamido-2,6-beta-L-arabino-hexul-4-ose reductase
LYGRSKKEGRLLFENWAKENNSKFSGLIIPNVFGAFGNPYYNSVVATFCHQLTHNETPQIEIDGDLKLIYIENLIKVIINEILNPADQINNISIPHNYEIKVSTLLNKLKNYKMQYFERGEFPEINNELDRDLFITFLTYIDHKSFFPFKLKMNTDNRGSFVETVKLNSGGQISFSTTVPGITRGNHYHTRKAERFAVIKGKALIELRKINTTEVLSFELNGNEPSFVDMPIWYTHNIKNIGSEDLYTIFWINEFFNPNDPDTYFETV